MPDVKRQARFIQYPSQHEVFHFLDDALANPKGAAVLYGPKVAGKSDLIEQIAAKVGERAAVAVIDGAGMKPTRMLTATLTAYGYELELSSVDELLGMISVFAVQQTRSREAPVLIIENFNRMYPSALFLLCKLAMLSAGQYPALRFILVGDEGYRAVIDAPNMSQVADRVVGEFKLQPLTARESLIYLYARLQALGIEHPDTVFETDVCRSLHAATEGWPGKLDEVAEAVAARADEFPIELDVALADTRHEGTEDDLVPELIVSYDGSVTARVRLVRDRYIVGRSDLSDIVLGNRFVSKHHALLVKSEYGLIIVDMKSRNGTFVNSARVMNRILENNDVVSLGDYRIKVICPAGYSESLKALPMLADTATMQNIADARRARDSAADVQPDAERRKA